MTKSNIDSELNLAILGLLSIQPLSGYGLRKVFLTTAMGSFSASPGAIYPALRKLEASGLVKGTVENARTLRPRKAYVPTAAGLAALRETLREPVTREDIRRRMDHLLLRFSLMDGLLPKAAILDFLAAFRRETEAYIKVLENEIRRDTPMMPACGRAAGELGLESYRLNAHWAKRTLARFQAEFAKKGERS